MEIALRALVLRALADDPVLSAELNSITEEAPARASLPWLALVASASVDWSHKTGEGREIRLAIELQCRGDDPATASGLVRRIEEVIAGLAKNQPDFTIASVLFLRARTQQRLPATRAVLIEHRFRLLAA
ncbi:DUF3168 domain-containing protein [Croceicoccus sp. F390]|uniref:DUF3168 domain-containing protein n=1 Tax=Croceicoccus esteveae TaxID=3075597 RepID=A0ABU2ZJP7_9SPHN|nr:DUF3168 domain-containing protein [Croceicoccus sp. F390]MDT0576529.1 DUF3168 domain-containing protein [Croceicoccus sp. F390]